MNFESGVHDLFRRSVKVETTSSSFEALNPVDMLIHTAINNAYGHDDAMRLIWVYDIKMLALKLAVPDDWKALQKRSVQWRARRAVELSLEMARTWLGLKLHQDFKDFSTWPSPFYLEADTWHDIVNQSHNLISRIRLHLPDSSNPFKKIQSFVHFVFPPPAKMRKDYPYSHGLFLPVSHLRRWYKWVKKVSS